MTVLNAQWKIKYMGSLVSHCYDILKESGVYENFQKPDENEPKASENFEKMQKIELDVPYFPNPEIIEGSESDNINSDFSYLHGHEPNFPIFPNCVTRDPVVDLQHIFVLGDAAL